MPSSLVTLVLWVCGVCGQEGFGRNAPVIRAMTSRRTRSAGSQRVVRPEGSCRLSLTAAARKRCMTRHRDRRELGAQITTRTNYKREENPVPGGIAMR